MNTHKESRKDKKTIKHIHDDPRIDCPACVAWIKSPLPRIYPYPQSPQDKVREKLMNDIVDYEFAQIKDSKILRTWWGTLIWTPKTK